MRLTTKFISSRIILPSETELSRSWMSPRNSEEELLLDSVLSSPDRTSSSSHSSNLTRTRGRSLGSFDYNEKPLDGFSAPSSPHEPTANAQGVLTNGFHQDQHHSLPTTPVTSISHFPPINDHDPYQRDLKSNDANEHAYYTPYKINTPRRRIDHLITHTQRFAVLICKSRFIIKQNVTIPLWLTLPLPIILAGILSYVMFAALLGKSVSGGILPSVSRGPPEIREIAGGIDKPFVLGCMEPKVDEPRANAVLVVLARNKEIEGVVQSMTSLERHFNRWYHYPYVFLNDEPFNSTFKEAIRNATDSEVKFGTIDAKTWNFPEWADEEDIEEAIAQQGDRAIMYGGMASYHRMCRFYSGSFFNHPLLAEYSWYWRVEPEVTYFCDITYDPFKYMEKHNKVYGFTIIIKELVETVPNLFRHTAAFKQEHNITSKGMWELFLKKHENPELGDTTKDSGSVRRKKKIQLQESRKAGKIKAEKLQESLPEEAIIGDPEVAKNGKGKVAAGRDLLPLEDNDQVLDIENYDYFANDIPPYSINGETYNMCHFWSNFEIARLDFFRSDEYRKYFETLDRTGGFWAERWGDAPVHSLAAGLFLAPEQVHYFRDVGYRHTTIQHCPANAPERQRPHVPFIKDPTDRKQIEEDDYWANFDPEVTNGVGCRCRCDTDVVEVEGKDGSCLSDWVDLTGGWV